VTDPAAELGRLLDERAITRLLAWFCHCVDEYDIDGAVSVFAEACVVDYGPGRGGPRHGRTSVGTRIAEGQAGFRRTHHQLGQSMIDIEGDTARAETYVTAWHRERDESVSEVRLRYLDRLARTSTGWTISSRRVQANGIVGFAGVEWDYVPRRLVPADDQ